MLTISVTSTNFDENEITRAASSSPTRITEHTPDLHSSVASDLHITQIYDVIQKHRVACLQLTQRCDLLTGKLNKNKNENII